MVSPKLPQVEVNSVTPFCRRRQNGQARTVTCVDHFADVRKMIRTYPLPGLPVPACIYQSLRRTHDPESRDISQTH